MFEAIARFDIRFRWLIVAVWVVGVVAGIRLLPSLADVTKTSNSQFLPASAPSQHAAGLAAPFQGHDAGATARRVHSHATVAIDGRRIRTGSAEHGLRRHASRDRHRARSTRG